MRGPRIVTMALPYDQEALWHPSLNIVALAPHLDAAGRERALDELLAQWRASLPPVALDAPVGAFAKSLSAVSADTR